MFLKYFSQKQSCFPSKPFCRFTKCKRTKRTKTSLKANFTRNRSLSHKICLVDFMVKTSKFNIFNNCTNTLQTKNIQSNLCTTTTIRTPNLWPLLNGGRCLEVGLCYEDSHVDSKMKVAVGRWSLFEGGR